MRNIYLLFLLPLFALTTLVAQAQPYRTGLGMRISPLYGVTVKHFTSPAQALELIVSSRWRGLQVSGMYEVHSSPFGQVPILIYAGIGGHVGLWRDGRYNPWYQAEFFTWRNDDWDYFNSRRDPDEGRIMVGMDMMVGMEYVLKDLPLSLSLDWKPLLNLVGGNSLYVEDLALSVRFVLK